MSMMSVQIKEGALRSRPSFLGGIVARVAYGDRVAIRERQGSWLKVGFEGQSVGGWIHSSALTTKKIVLRAGDQDVRRAASSDELALAGKGFNQEVEDAYRTKNPKVDFSWIDKMEKIVVSQNEMQAFLQEGNVTPEGGW